MVYNIYSREHEFSLYMSVFSIYFAVSYIFLGCSRFLGGSLSSFVLITYGNPEPGLPVPLHVVIKGVRGGTPFSLCMCQEHRSRVSGKKLVHLRFAVCFIASLCLCDSLLWTGCCLSGEPRSLGTSLHLSPFFQGNTWLPAGSVEADLEESSTLHLLQVSKGYPCMAWCSCAYGPLLLYLAN